MIVKDEDITRNLIPDLFPGGNKELFATIFRNDLVSFLFQNELRKYKLGDAYNSFEIKENFRVKPVNDLSRGAFVKDGVLYVDEKQLQPMGNVGQFKIIAFKEKPNWELVPKYNIGVKY